MSIARTQQGNASNDNTQEQKLYVAPNAVIVDAAAIPNTNQVVTLQSNQQNQTFLVRHVLDEATNKWEVHTGTLAPKNPRSKPHNRLFVYPSRGVAFTYDDSTPPKSDLAFWQLGEDIPRVSTTQDSFCATDIVVVGQHRVDITCRRHKRDHVYLSLSNVTDEENPDLTSPIAAIACMPQRLVAIPQHATDFLLVRNNACSLWQIHQHALTELFAYDRPARLLVSTAETFADNPWVMIGYNDGSLELHHLRSTKQQPTTLLGRLALGSRSVDQLIAIPHSPYLVAVSENTVYWVDASTPEKLKVVSQQTLLRQLSNEKRKLAVTQDGMVITPYGEVLNDFAYHRKLINIAMTAFNDACRTSDSGGFPSIFRDYISFFPTVDRQPASEEQKESPTPKTVVVRQ